VKWVYSRLSNSKEMMQHGLKRRRFWHRSQDDVCEECRDALISNAKALHFALDLK
jgi:hypothetical protein